MEKEKSTDSKQVNEYTTSHSTSVDRDVQLNVQMVQNVLLVWLDENIDEQSNSYCESVAHLRYEINTVGIFTDSEECIDFLGDIADEKACMIVSGSVGQKIVPLVHNMPQVNSIFIFCENENFHQEWIKHWSKITGIFTTIASLCEALNEAVQQCEQNAISISIIPGDDNLAEKTENRLDPSFMYTQIIKEIFLTINFEQQHIDEFIQYCQETLAGNEKQLKHVHQLAEQYHQHTPIWWYTRECFLYRMLNRALRTMDVNLMMKLGFFISDLHRHIEQLKQEQFSGDGSNQCFNVYCGQGMDKTAFQNIIANKGGLLSFNSFLSTSKSRSTSFAFTRRALMDDQLVGILFVMHIDPARSSTPFASVGEVGCLGNREDEVLFSMHSVFRIGEFTSLSDDRRLFEVQLRLASDKDNDLRQLIDSIREETFPGIEGWYRLGLALGKIGEYAKAQQLYEFLLYSGIDENIRATIYDQLGWTLYGLGSYAEAIKHLDKSIEIRAKQNPRNKLALSMSYDHMGVVYGTIGDYPKALSSFEKALAIEGQLLPPNHPDLAASYGNIGNVYGIMGGYSEALLSYQKALTIQKQSLPSIHPSLATSYNNIGNIYNAMGNYLKALLSYEKALTIRQQSLPTTHLDLAASYNNIGIVHSIMGDYSKSLSFHEKALMIRQQSLPPIHLDLVASYDNIGLVYRNMGDYPKALSSYEKALTIQQQSLHPTHPDLVKAYYKMGSLHKNMGNYWKAYSYFEHLVDIAQRVLPADHPHLRMYQTHLAGIEKKL